MLLIPPLRNGHERTRTGISGHFGPYCGDRAITLVESQADQASLFYAAGLSLLLLWTPRTPITISPSNWTTNCLLV
jgi:hypothetical protein